MEMKSMATDSKFSPSFSPRRRWKIGLDTALRTILVLAVIVMANYLGSTFSRQFYLSPHTRIHLSPLTVGLLQSLTNRVDVTVYYDTGDEMYPTVIALLNEYHRLDPRISVKVVDYIRDPGEAAQIKEKYHLVSQITNPNAPPAKNLIIFDCEGRVKVLPGDALTKYTLEPIPNSTQREFRRKPIEFNGELAFTSMLQGVTNPKPFMAYFLQGHGEPSLTDSGDLGYLKFAAVLEQNYIRIEPLNLLGDNPIPADCNLLIIADSTSGEPTPLSDSELKKINDYLSQGGRLLALLGYYSIRRPTGLEDLLAQWGVNVGSDFVEDPGNTISGSDVVVKNFSGHPVVNPLTGLALEMVLPRPVSRINEPDAPANAPDVTELAFSSPASFLSDDRSRTPRSYPLMAAVEQKSVKGIANAGGGARIVIAGDSMFLDNQMIESVMNRDFAGYAVNWLLDRPMLLKGIGPQPVLEFRLMMTQTQMNQVRWLLLAALPGAVLALGGLVWLRRRK
jgi:gliding motility-associatede transport system auxiliary component